MRRHLIAIGIAAAVLAGCGPLADLTSGESDAPDEGAQEETAQDETSSDGDAPEDSAQDEVPPAGGPAEPDDSSEGDGDAPSDDGAWDHAVRTNFLDACLGSSGNASGYCECALISFEERFTQAEFETLEQEMMASDETPPEFDEVIEACYDEHVAGAVEESVDGQWSAMAQSDFLEGCIQTSGGMTAHCECALDGLQEIYSETEFIALSAGFERGEDIPAEFDEVVETCLEQHG